MKLFHTPLFLGITESEFETMKELHSMRSSFFFKNGTIFHTGDLIHEIGIIESGSVNIENIDLLGNKSILSNISQGQIFAETYAICHEPMLVDVVAIEDTQVLFADLDILLSNRYASQPWHAKIMQNILKLSVQKIWFYRIVFSVLLPNDPLPPFNLSVHGICQSREYYLSDPL